MDSGSWKESVQAFVESEGVLGKKNLTEPKLYSREEYFDKKTQFKSIVHVCKRYSAIHVSAGREESCFVSKVGLLCREKIISIFHSKMTGLTIFITCSAVEGTGELASSEAEIKVNAT